MQHRTGKWNERIRILRKQSKYSQKEVAGLLKISQPWKGSSFLRGITTVVWITSQGPAMFTNPSRSSEYKHLNANT